MRTVVAPPEYYEPPELRHCPVCQGCEEPEFCEWCKCKFHADEECGEAVYMGEGHCGCEGVEWSGCQNEDEHRYCYKHGQDDNACDRGDA